MVTRPPGGDEHRDAAIAWFVRLQDCDDGRVWRDHFKWLEGNPARVAAFDAVSRLWVRLDDLSPRDAMPESNVVYLSERRPRPLRRHLWWIPAVAAAAAVIGWTQVGQNRSPASETIESAADAPRVIDLADGSRLTLNRDSKVKISLSSDERRVELVSGEVAFDIKHNAARPFTVFAGKRSVQVLGTEFNVLNYGGAFAVSVRRGLVAVSPVPGNGESRELPAGTTLIQRPGGQADSIIPGAVDEAFAWTTGRLVYIDRPLGEVAQDLGRYDRTTVVVAPELARMRVTAVLTIKDNRSLDRQLELLLPVQIEPFGSARRIVPAR